MRLTRIFAFIALAMISISAPAEEQFVVTDIKVLGLERIAIGTVFNYLPIKVGDRITKTDVSNAIRSLFKTGFFQDVKISHQQGVILVTVSEQPSISEIEVKGSSKIPEDKLLPEIKKSGLAVGYTFSRSLLEKVDQELKAQYYNLGFYSAKIKSSVESTGGNKVKIRIDIAEGKPVRIRDIKIIGAKQVLEKDLLSQFRLRAKKRPFSKRDQYSQQELQGDIEKLQNYYLDNGYLDFELKSQQVSIAPDRESIFIALVVSEGAQYRIGDIGIKGKIPVDEASLRDLITVNKGEIFSRKKLTSDIDKMTELLGENGYSNAKISSVPKTDKSKRTVSFDYLVDAGKRVYVRRIDIRGNNITKDKVIRRELQQLEGSWYSLKKLKASQRRLHRLGYFEEIDVHPKPVENAVDLIDIEIKVKERSTGSVTLGGGYSDENGFFVNVGYNERNAFGTGNDIVLSYDNSQATTVYEMSYSNPYYTRSGISRQIEVHSRATDATQLGTGGYNTVMEGLGINYGIPIGEDRRLGLGIGFEQVNISTTATSADVAKNYVTTFGNSNNLLSTTLSWSQDTLNDYRFPTDGAHYRVNLESGIPGGDLTYVKGSVDTSVYFPFGPMSTLRVRGKIGLADGYGDTAELPFYKNFFAGGASSVRGFRARSLGPRDTGAIADPIGGNKLLNANMEYFFPFPGVKDQSSSMRLSLFLDAGMVYAANEALNTSTLRYSAGMAFTWFTPAFPIALSLGYPLNSEPGDQLESFQFSIGIPLQ